MNETQCFQRTQRLENTGFLRVYAKSFFLIK